ncbi:MAG: hypothetical protein LUG18_11340 [Candidatus Azobacteroides sp.]|nr:hypothetical protein [Candidatus Azobacteroides sp.]
MKTFTNDDDIATKREKIQPGPQKNTLNFLKNFARVYQVANTEKVKKKPFRFKLKS